MAASDTELFFELTNAQFVQATDSPSQIAGPVFIAGDVTQIRLKLLRMISPLEAEIVDLSGISATIAIGTAAAAPTVLTSATSGAVDADGFLPFTLPFNLAAVTNALGSAAEIYPLLELRVVSGANPQRYQTTCTIRQWLITNTLQDPPAAGIATTLDEVMSLMVPRDGSNASHPNTSIIFLDEEDTSKVYRFTIRAGQPHVEQIA